METNRFNLVDLTNATPEQMGKIINALLLQSLNMDLTNIHVRGIIVDNFPSARFAPPPQPFSGGKWNLEDPEIVSGARSVQTPRDFEEWLVTASRVVSIAPAIDFIIKAMAHAAAVRVASKYPEEASRLCQLATNFNLPVRKPSKEDSNQGEEPKE